jgi:peptide chain release factor 2
VERARREIDELQEAAMFTGEYDVGPAVVTVNAGAGGTDAQDWAEMLVRMYLRWAERRNFKAELIEATAGEEAGLKSATFILNGENAYGIMQAERGVHRLVRQSPFDNAHRRHTAFAGLELAPWIDDDVHVDIDEKDLRIDTYRASGAGGQHVNKTDSAVRSRTSRRAPSSSARTSGRRRRTRRPPCGCSRAACWSGRSSCGGRDRQGARRGSGHLLRQPDPLLRPAPVHDRQRPSHGPEGGQRPGVLDGDLDPFIHAYLLGRATDDARRRRAGAPAATARRRRIGSRRRPSKPGAMPYPSCARAAARYPDALTASVERGRTPC